MKKPKPRKESPLDTLVINALNDILTDQQKMGLVKDPIAFEKLAKGIKEAAAIAVTNLTTPSVGSAIALCTLPACPSTKLSDVPFVKEIGMDAVDRLFGRYPKTGSEEAVTIAIPKKVSTRSAWRSLQKSVSFDAIQKRCLTPMQVDYLIEHLKKEDVNKTRVYLVPILGYNCIRKHREDYKEQPDNIGKGMNIYQITFQKKSTRLGEQEREMSMGIALEVSIDDETDIVEWEGVEPINRPQFILLA